MVPRGPRRCRRTPRSSWRTDKLLAFPLSCAGACTPAWTGSLPGSAAAARTLSTPLVDGDSVYIAGADGTLYVFATSCAQTSCAPVATYPLGPSPL